MSTQHCGFTAPVASTTVYLFGAVHSTDKVRADRIRTGGEQKENQPNNEMKCGALDSTDL